MADRVRAARPAARFSGTPAAIGAPAPAVQRGVDLAKELRRSAPPTEEERRILFNQTARS